MRVGSKDYMGTFEFELGSRIQDTVNGPISESYIQHWFQEEFLHLFYEDSEFREQVLKCLLTGETEDGTLQVGKPRRTWFNGLDVAETQGVEVSWEEARYIYHCSENSNGLSAKVGNETIGNAIKICSAEPDKPWHTYECPQHVDEIQINERVKPVQKGLWNYEATPGEMQRITFIPDVFLEDQLDIRMNSRGLQPLCTHNVRYGAERVTPDIDSQDSLESPNRLSPSFQVQLPNLEETLTGSCLHGRGTQTWKANPLYLFSNSDRDSHDFLQQEYITGAWPGDLDNGRMLEEVKMRKMKMLEDFCPSLKMAGYQNWNDSLKEKNRTHLPKTSQGDTEDDNTAESQSNTTIDNEETAKSPTESIFGVTSPSVGSTLDEEETALEEAICRENMGWSDDLILQPSHLSFCTGTPYASIHGDKVQKSSSSSIRGETTKLDDDLVFKPSIITVSPTFSFAFIAEDSFSKISLEAPTPIQDTWAPSESFPPALSFEVNENEEPKSSFASISPAMKFEVETISPTATISGEPPRPTIDEYCKVKRSLESTRSFQGPTFSKLDYNVECKPLIDSTALASPSAGNDEKNSPLARILGPAKSLDGLPSISQEEPSRWPVESLGAEATEAHESMRQELRIVDEELPSLVKFFGPARESGSIIDKEMIEPSKSTGDMLSEKGIESTYPSAANSFGELSRMAITEEKDVVARPIAPPAGSACRGVTRVAFKPAQDIHWLPPKRNIKFMGMQHNTRTPAHHRLEIIRKTEECHVQGSLRREPTAVDGMAVDDCRDDNSPNQLTKENSTLNSNSRIHLWASLLRKLFKRTVMMGRELKPRKSDHNRQDPCSFALALSKSRSALRHLGTSKPFKN